MIQGTLGLSIRAPEPVSSNLVSKMTPRHVSRWLEQLPIANVSDSSKRLYQILLDCNKSALDDDDRYKILLSLHPSIQLVLKSLSKHFTGHTLNLSDKQKKIAALVQAIHTEMAIGFKTIIEHQAESPSLFQKGMLHGSLFMALEYLSLTVVRCYQVYTEVPSRLWKEINTIYRFALDHKLHRKTCNIEGFNQEHTIEEVYKKIALLSIANPYQLRQQEIEVVFNGLQKYIAHCDLELSNRFDNRFVVDLNQAFPPMHQALVKFRPSRHTFAFNLDKVVQELQQNLKDNSAKNRHDVAIGGLSIRLIRHLLKSWGHLSSRNFARTPCEGQVKVSVGLSATHQVLSDTDEDHEPQSTLADYEGSLHNATILDDRSTVTMLEKFGNQSFYNEPVEEDVWAKLYRPKQAVPATEEIDYASQFGKVPPNQLGHTYSLVDADIINISPGGYCIALEGQPPTNTQTGEVIGVVETEANGEEIWHVGVIRWIKRLKNNNGVQLGIQLIAPGAKPVKSQLKNGRTNGQVFQNALLLPELKGIGQPATLLTNPVLFSPKQKVTIIDGDQTFDAMLTKLVSSSQGYRQFYFERLPEKAGQISTNGPDLGPKDGFDNVWDLI
jgi:hypothetical protein